MRKAVESSIRSLINLGEKIIPYLKNFLKTKPPMHVKISVAMVLAKLGEQEGIDTFKEALNHEFVWIKSNAIEGLGEIGDPSVVPELMDCLVDSGPIRNKASVALAQIEIQNPGSLDIEKIKKRFQSIVESSGKDKATKRDCTKNYLIITKALGMSREKIEMPDLPKFKPPKTKSFRRRVAHA